MVNTALKASGDSLSLKYLIARMETSSLSGEVRLFVTRSVRLIRYLDINLYAK